MSLILYYRGCFTADRRITDLLDNDVQVFDKTSKLFLSEDNRFAGMACGMIPTPDQWLEIRNIIDTHSLSKDKSESFYTTGKSTDVEKALEKFVKSSVSSSSILIATRDLFLCYSYAANSIGVLDSLDRQMPYAHGTGKGAATVLINSEVSFSQKEFFQLVSYSDKFVSPEYDFIDLSKVIDTPWYKEKQNGR